MTQRRLRGYLRGLRDTGIEPDPALEAPGGDGLDDDYMVTPGSQVLISSAQG